MDREMHAVRAMLWRLFPPKDALLQPGQVDWRVRREGLSKFRIDVESEFFISTSAHLLSCLYVAIKVRELGERDLLSMVLMSAKEQSTNERVAIRNAAMAMVEFGPHNG